MSIGEVFQGSLFPGDLLSESPASSADWLAVGDDVLGELEASFRALFNRFPAAQSPNESQTEDDLIWPVLHLLGWNTSLRQQNQTARGRDDVPDGLLFADEATKDRANAFGEEWRRYELGTALVESKRWQQPLDRRPGVHKTGGISPRLGRLAHAAPTDA